MKKHLKVIYFILISIFFLSLPANAQKVYLDITSPGIRKLPIAIQTFSNGNEISDIIREDLDYTGLFMIIDQKAHIERNEQSFNPANWKGLHTEVVVKGSVIRERNLKVIFSIFDVPEGREVLRKEYSASKELYRQLAHSIANDIYKTITGQQGIFRTKVAYIAEKAKGKEISKMDWDGNRSLELGINGDILLSPKWSSEGSKLIYSKNKNRQWGIFVLDINSMRERNVIKDKGLSITGNFLPNNREFVFVSSKDGNSDIYIGDISSMSSRKVLSSPWIDVSPSVSPDGKRLTFVSNRGGNPQIYISDLNGGNLKKITNEGSYNTSPTWSPKGDKIAFSSMIGGKHQIFIMNTDGSGLTQLTNIGNNEEPSFSPDGRFIAFSSDREGAKGIYTMRVDGGGQRRITPKGIKSMSPSWSPYLN